MASGIELKTAQGSFRGAAGSQSGFTLIEMSIVLVIIGLIIGGIIKGQEVVANARTKSQVAQMDAIKGAVYTFQDKYGFLPGDYASNTALGLSASLGKGNQDGIINDVTSGTAVGMASVIDTQDVSSATAYEAPIAWLQISAAGLLTSVNTNLQALSVATTATYAGKVGNSYVWLSSFYNVKSGISGVAARLGSGTGTPGGVFRAIDAYSLDEKFDDGAPYSGGIIANGSTDSTCVVSSAYSSASPQSLGCALDFFL